MFKINRSLTRYYTKSNGSLHFPFLNNFTSVPITATIRNLEPDSDTVQDSKNPTINTVLSNITQSKSNKEHNALVAAAFASLKNQQNTITNTVRSEINLQEFATVAQLLTIADNNGISRKRALEVISILAEWSSTGKVKLSDFESDPRFIKLCRILTKRNNLKTSLIGARSEDLSTIINVTADDEAAKLITSISLPQMIKVMSTLAQRKRRSTPLLRSLAFNIAANAEHLDLKQCSDLLYSSAILNFIDENMFEKVCTDICIGIQENIKGSAVIGSILTSLGHLRYKDIGILDSLTEWILTNNRTCRNQDICSLFITLASVNCHPSSIEEVNEVLVPQLKESEISKSMVWLDVVWSLVVLNLAKPEHISSVLKEDFIKKIEHDGKMSIPARLKLLNIDSACDSLINNYKGPRLSNDTNINHTVISRTKDKLILICALQDTIGNLLNPKTHLKTNTYTDMGFYIDAELILDKKCNPLPITTSSNVSDYIKVAVIALDFHDMCRGCVEPNGLNVLFFKLLEAKGYRILSIPYTEFNPKDKLVNRVKYFESNLKRVSQEESSKV